MYVVWDVREKPCLETYMAVHLAYCGIDNTARLRFVIRRKQEPNTVRRVSCVTATTDTQNH